MSHIPNSAMKHAGPVHHADEAPLKSEEVAAPQSRGHATRAWIAIGGTILATAAAAIALPLLRGGGEASKPRRGRKENAAR